MHILISLNFFNIIKKIRTVIFYIDAYGLRITCKGSKCFLIV